MDLTISHKRQSFAGIHLPTPQIAAFSAWLEIPAYLYLLTFLSLECLMLIFTLDLHANPRKVEDPPRQDDHKSELHNWAI